ncbi:hypothetical protein [Streptomyces sp. NPDC093089]
MLRPHHDPEHPEPTHTHPTSADLPRDNPSRTGTVTAGTRW